MSAAGLAAAALSAVLYQCTGKSDLRPPGASSQQAPSIRSPQTSRTQREPSPANNPARTAPGTFDFYLLALSVAPAFCDDGHQNKGECRALDAGSFAATPLTLHGLWPENIQPGSYPHDCGGAEPPSLSSATHAAMSRWMPGVVDGLENHEWSKHGTCTGLSADDYFGSAMRLAERVNAAVGPAIRNAAGGSVDAAALRAAANTSQAGMGDSLTFVCKNLRGAPEGQRRRPYLMEVRVCIDNDGPAGAPQSLMQCAAVQRRDQGCGGSFQIDAR